MKKQLLETLERAKDYTLAVAEAMPETDYTFKPTGASWNFVELLNHIGYGIAWWKANYILQQEDEWQPPISKRGKEETIRYLQQAFLHLEKTCISLPLTDEMEIQGFHATLDHVTHHRGQAVTYLRCNGITPPEYMY